MGTVLTIFGYNLTYLELIGSIFNFISVILATRANLWNWVTSIIAQFCFFFLFWYTGLYANMLLQVYFSYICLISIFIWKKTDKKEDKGLISGGEGGGKNLTQNSGPTTVVPPTPSGDRLFDVQGKGYSGPENWKPTDQGTTNPYEIGKS